MAGFGSYRDLALAHENGQTFTSHFRKAPSNTTIASWWFDLSMASGNPPPQYYASTPLESNVLDGFRGLFHGDDKAPADLYLTELMLCSPTAGFVGRYLLLDYLMFYPFIDMDDTDLQTMAQVDALPRYTDGGEVMVMAVALTPTTGSGTFTVDYVNQDGNPATTPTQFCTTTAANIGSIVTSQPATVAGQGPFLTLASGDTGVQQITGMTMLVPNGGLCALVLVKVLADATLREINTPAEKPFIGPRSGGVKIEDGAYLNFTVQTAATVASGTLTGRLNFAWN